LKTDAWPLTIRQIFDRLVGAHGYEKTEQAYDRLIEYGRPKIDSATERNVRKVTKSLGIATGTVQRISKERAIPRGAQQ